MWQYNWLKGPCGSSWFWYFLGGPHATSMWLCESFCAKRSWLSHATRDFTNHTRWKLCQLSVVNSWVFTKSQLRDIQWQALRDPHVMKRWKIFIPRDYLKKMVETTKVKVKMFSSQKNSKWAPSKKLEQFVDPCPFVEWSNVLFYLREANIRMSERGGRCLYASKQLGQN